MLQNKVAGLDITANSGQPGAATTVKIRGNNSVRAVNNPLYVIDGVPVQNESNINFLNPNDVESIQVLKDAASASIYGSRAANGVIVITTKRGKSGTSKLSVDIFYGNQTPSKIPETLNPLEFLKVQQELAKGQGIPFSSNIYINQGGTWVLPDFAVRGLGGFLAGDPAVDADDAVALCNRRLELAGQNETDVGDDCLAVLRHFSRPFGSELSAPWGPRSRQQCQSGVRATW